MTSAGQAPDGPIPFTKPPIGEDEIQAVVAALRAGSLGGNEGISRRVQARLAERLGVAHAQLTPSATSAIEVSLVACDVGPGDEVLMPSFAFVSQANAILARGARPVFCDVDPATLNIDPAEVERRVGPRTRMVMPVHYAGIPSEMEALGRIAREAGLWLVEDAAQGVGSTWRGRALGTIGHMGCVSFHVTKNLVCGEGGALVTDDDELARKSEIIREKGTNRAAFLRGEVDKYTWVGPGGSYVLSDLLAALLEVQLARLDAITAERTAIWERYHAALEPLEREGRLRRPSVPADSTHNGHIYWVLAESPELQQRVLDALREAGVKATFHFQPLHASPYARERLGPPEDLPVSIRASETIIRLPLWSGLSDAAVERVIDATLAAFRA